MNNTRVVSYFSAYPHEPRSSMFFVKALMFVTLVRVVRLWFVSDILFAEGVGSMPRSVWGKVLLLPSELFSISPHLFFAGVILFLIIAMTLRPDYRINLVFFWVVLNLFKIKYPVTNGADFVLLVFSLICIPLALKPAPKNVISQTATVTIFNLFRAMAQWQVLLIYLISAWDKVKSDVWTSGDAFEYIGHIDVMTNPLFVPMLENPAVNFLLSWLTILFEFGFLVFVYIKRTRLAILCVGVVFHIVIWLMLGLPDFAWTMIATYAIFLKDAEINLWGRRFRLLPQ
jgi:hypothetical protein